MSARSSVPCGSCKVCCKDRNLIVLMPDEGDDVASYDHVVTDLPKLGQVPILRHAADGNCIYLGPEGCTIHGRAPFICRIFDCRRFFLAHSRSERRMMLKKDACSKEVFDAGRERLPSLKEPP